MIIFRIIFSKSFIFCETKRSIIHLTISTGASLHNQNFRRKHGWRQHRKVLSSSPTKKIDVGFVHSYVIKNQTTFVLHSAYIYIDRWLVIEPVPRRDRVFASISGNNGRSRSLYSLIHRDEAPLIAQRIRVMFLPQRPMLPSQPWKKSKHQNLWNLML